jgi:hypothetical protein
VSVQARKIPSCVPSRKALWATVRSRGTSTCGTWLEICFCWEPLDEEKPYWEEYFELVKIQDAHSRRLCRDLNGSEPWACSDCDCTEKLEKRMEGWGRPFLNAPS